VVRLFKPVVVRVGSVVLKAYELVEEKQVVEEVGESSEGALADALFKLLLREKRSLAKEREGGLVEVSCRAKDVVVAVGEAPSGEGGSGQLLFPRPAKLKRVGLWSGGEVKWVSVGGSYYVYDGYVEAPRGVEVVLLETDRGTKVLRVEAPAGGKAELEEVASARSEKP